MIKIHLYTYKSIKCMDVKIIKGTLPTITIYSLEDYDRI